MPLPEAGGIRLEVAGLRADFLPHWGGRLAQLSHAVLGDLLAPLDLEAGFLPKNWPRGGAYPLVPFHNRLVEGRFEHLDQIYHLPANPNLGRDVMHGPGHQHPWQVVDRGKHSLTLELSWRATPDWPFDFLAHQVFTLREDGLELQLWVQNTDQLAQPLGLGWHPYFALAPTGLAWTDAAEQWPLDPLSLPSGFAPLPQSAGVLPNTTGWTEHFSNWQRAGFSPRPGWQVTVSAKNLPHLALHRMGAYLCIEPVSHRAGALALTGAAREAAGLISVAPGDRISAVINLHLQSIEQER